MSPMWAELEPLLAQMLAFKHFHIIYPFKRNRMRVNCLKPRGFFRNAFIAISKH